MRPPMPGLVVIGASAGGIAAINAVLGGLGADFPLPVVIVQHVREADRRLAFAKVFRAPPGLEVREADDKDALQAGSILIAPPGYHVLVESEGTVALNNDEPVHHSRPSIDVLFESAAEAFGRAVIGVLLTGASRDGAQGLAAIASRGGQVAVQDPEEAEVDTMPRAACEAAPEASVLRLAALGPWIRLAARRTRPEGGAAP